MGLYDQGLQNIVSGFQNYAQMDKEKQNKLERQKMFDAQKQMTKRQRALQYSQAGLQPDQAMAVAEYEDTGNLTPQAELGFKTFSEFARQKREKQRGGKETPPKMTEAEKKFEAEAGKKLAEYQFGGGKQQVEANIKKLDRAIDRLKEPGDLTGGLLQKLPFGTSDWAIDIADEDLATVRDDVRGAIQDTLRATLGPQFTEKEGERIFNMAFNPRLSDEENIKRASDVSSYLKNLAGSKDQALEFFRKNKTLAGFQPMQVGQNNKMYAENNQQMPVGQGVLLPEAQQNIPTNVPIQNQIIPSANAAPENDFLNLFKTPEGISAIEAEKRRRGLK